VGYYGPILIKLDTDRKTHAEFQKTQKRASMSILQDSRRRHLENQLTSTKKASMA
jgi:hypothetical protein